MNYTSIEQSKHLLELGLSIESADMTWNDAKITNGEPTVMAQPYSKYKDFFNVSGIPSFLIPCWSVGALLDLMPDVIEYNNKHGYYLDIHKRCPYESISDMYIIQYDANIYNVKPKAVFKSNDLIESVYNMVVWLLENKYIKKGV